MIIDAKKYAAEYRKAWDECKSEQQTFGGVWDVFKALMLIQPKTPEQRVLQPAAARASATVTSEK